VLEAIIKTILTHFLVSLFSLKIIIVTFTGRGDRFPHLNPPSLPTEEES
jgi:hypothetical protein